MVTTRKHPEGEEEQMFGEEGRQPQAEKQTGQIAKKPKTKPLQQADRELEQGLEEQFSKEKAELGKEGLEEPEEGGEGEEYEPGQGEEEEEEEEEEEGEEGEEEEEEEMEGRKLPAGGQQETEGQAGGGAKKKQQQQQKGKGTKGKAAAAGGGAKGLQVGEPAPDFSLQNQDGKTISLKDFKGKHVAIYFYNKDDTPVVTKGGSAFAEVFPQMEKMGVPLLFIGPDSVDSHKHFRDKAKLPFQLLSDPKKEVARAFNNLRGRNVLRTTVLVDPEGKVLKVYANIPETEVTSNPKEALQFMTSLMQEQEA